jgi:S-DNA-T family DNA segregation ATPase FtsK/SpoIIIE
MFKRNKKQLNRIIPGWERTEDSRPFFIPKISELQDKVTMKRKFVSPIFGKNVKDEVSVPPSSTNLSGDIDKRYDPFRRKKKLTKEEAKRRYGDAYYDFHTVQNADKNRMVKGELDPDFTKKNRTTPPEVDVAVQTPIVPIEQVSIDEFFGGVEESEVKESTLDEMTFALEKEEGDFDVNRFAPLEEEEEESLLFIPNEESKPKPVLQRIPEEDESKESLQNPILHHSFQSITGVVSDFKDYFLPPVSLMKKSPEISESSDDWIKANIDIINQTLVAFDIGGEVSTITKGPTVTRYEIALLAGVPTKKITSISDNIQMNLAALSIRIEAPIPGKTTIGIEVPNKIRESVYFGDIIDNPKFLQHTDPLLLAIGLDIDANPVYTSIEAMPHGLVAGSTQSGKSVAIASIIASILYKNKPDQVKLMLIDPKKVDLQQFSEIPHLVTPIIDDPKMAVEALKWGVREMENRYDILKRFKAVNVKDYYDRRRHDREFVKMPRIVVIVEEASDLLINGGPEVEENILKLTQKSRAVGIHLILATQRPSADIIKGSIKANIPTRFAFKVPSSVDSSVVLDQTGAEKLLGMGDMLLSENGHIRRLQGAYLSPQEIEALTEFIKHQAHPHYLFTHESLIKANQVTENAAELDELFFDVARYVVTEERCSLNKITQEFNVGFNRATQIVSSLELYGVVSRNVGTKSREVLVNDRELQGILQGLGQE